jgi:DNA (cytosine-5)-methyltransferase 1
MTKADVHGVAVAFHPTQDPISSTDGSVHAMGCGSSGGSATQAVAFPINTMTLGGRPDEANDRKMTMGVGADGDPQFTLQAAHSHAVGTDIHSCVITGDVAATMGTKGSAVNGHGPTLMQAMTVRRLTPKECERLQGFPDDYTLIPWRKKAAGDCPDGPRYKALGNSMAVNVVTWIGERIAAFEAEKGTT